MQEIKQNTAIKIRIGPAVDALDGVTPVTTVTLGAADQAELLKHDGTATTDITGSTFTPVTNCDGWYDLQLTITDTDTLGQITVVIQDLSLIVPIFRDFMVTTENYWDSKYGTDKLEVDAVAILDENVEGTCTLRQMMSLITSISAAKSTGGGTSVIIFRDIYDTKDRMTATVDANGNRIITDWVKD